MDGSSSRDERLIGGRTGRSLAVVAFGVMTAYAGRVMLSPLLPAVIDDLSISPTAAGFALTLLAATSALSQFPAGRLADELTRKTVLVGSLLLTGVGLALLATTTSYVHLLAGALVTGAGAGGFLPASSARLSDLFVARRGQAFGVYEAALNAGGIVASGLAVALLAAVGWRGALLPVLAGVAVAALLTHRAEDGRYALRLPSLGAADTGLRLARDREVRSLLVVLGLGGFVWEGTVGFLPTYLRVAKGLDSALAGNAFGGFFLIGILVNLVAGRFGDRFGHLAVGGGATLASAVGVLGLLRAASVGAVLAAVALTAVGLTAFWPVMLAYLMDTVPDSTMGGDFGALSTAFIAVGSVGPLYVGAVADRLSYRAALLGFVACLLVCAAAIRWLSRVEG